MTGAASRIVAAVLPKSTDTPRWLAGEGSCARELPSDLLHGDGQTAGRGVQHILAVHPLDKVEPGGDAQQERQHNDGELQKEPKTCSY